MASITEHVSVAVVAHRLAVAARRRARARAGAQALKKNLETGAT